MAATIFEVLTEQIQEHINACEHAAISGKCPDYAEYKYVCGQIRGLKVAQQSVNDLQRNIQEDDDEQ